MRIFDFSNSTTGSYLDYTPKSSNNDARAAFDTTTASEVYAATAAGTNAAQGSRNFVAVVVDAAANTLSLYLDGASSGTASLGGANIAPSHEAYAYLGRSSSPPTPASPAPSTNSVSTMRLAPPPRIAADNTTGPAFAPATELPPKQAENLTAASHQPCPIPAGEHLIMATSSAPIPPPSASTFSSSDDGGPAKRLNSRPPITTGPADYVDSAANHSYVNKCSPQARPQRHRAGPRSGTSTPSPPGFSNELPQHPPPIPPDSTHARRRNLRLRANDCSVGNI